MKRFWLAFFAVAAATSMVGTANAQWNQSPEIGSYQSILSRTGYGASQAGGSGTVPGSLPGQLVGMTTQSAGSDTRQAAPVGSATREAAPMSYAPQASYAPQTSYAPQASYAPQQVMSGCNGNCGSGGVVNSVGPVMGDGAVYGAATPCASGSCGGGAVVSGDSYIDGGYTDLGAGYSAGSCGDPVYTPGASIGGVDGVFDDAYESDQVNRVGGVFGVIFRRNYGDRVRIGANAGEDIFSDDVSHGNFSGIGASVAARKANGNGREFVYWGLNDDIDIDYIAPDFVSIRQLDDLRLGAGNLAGNTTVLDRFNSARSLRIHRSTEINNIEANLLRNGGHYSTRRGKSGNFELSGGLRLFQFDESLRVVGSGPVGTTEYRLDADNFLVGAQLGARNEVCLSQRLRLSTGINVGLFNNRSETRQRVFDENGTNAIVNGGPASGRDFDYSDTKDDVAIMGEFRVGLIMQITDRIRANAGYRALGVGGVALAEDQIPLNALDPGLLERSQTNGTLLLHGFYFGGEACF